MSTKNVSVKLDSRLYTALKTRAALDESNVSDEIRSLLRSALAAEGLDLYGNEVAGFIRGVVDARMDVAALDIERKLDATEDRIAAVLSRPMTAATKYYVFIWICACSVRDMKNSTGKHRKNTTSNLYGDVCRKLLKTEKNNCLLKSKIHWWVNL